MVASFCAGHNTVSYNLGFAVCMRVTVLHCRQHCYTFRHDGLDSVPHTIWSVRLSLARITTHDCVCQLAELLACMQGIGDPQEGLASSSDDPSVRRVSSAPVPDRPVSSLDLSQPWVPASSPISAKQYMPAEAAALSCNAAGYSSDELEGRKRSRQCWEDQSWHEAPHMSATEIESMSLQVGHLENLWAGGLVSASIVPSFPLQNAHCILTCMLVSLLWEHSAGARPSSHLTPV